MGGKGITLTVAITDLQLYISMLGADSTNRMVS